VKSGKSFEEDEVRRKKDYDKQYEKSKEQVLRDMKHSEKNMSLNQSKVKINDIDIDLDDLDMKKLTKEQKQDIKEIERLQEQVANLTGNLTLGNVSDIDRNFSMRPTVLTQSSQAR
jgi:hypothetical protein